MFIRDPRVLSLNFHYILFRINRQKNLTPPERLEIKHQDEALGCTFLSRFLSRSINEQGGLYYMKKLRAGWKENLKNLSEHALLLGTSE